MELYTPEEILEQFWIAEKIPQMKFPEEDAKKIKDMFLQILRRAYIDFDGRMVKCRVSYLKSYSELFPEPFYSEDFISTLSDDDEIELDEIYMRLESLMVSENRIPCINGVDYDTSIYQCGIFIPDLNCFELAASGLKSDILAWAEKLEIGNAFIILDPTRNVVKPTFMVVSVSPNTFQH